MTHASAINKSGQDAAGRNSDAPWADRILAAVSRYRAAGFRCVPLQPGDKGPLEGDRMGRCFAVRASGLDRTIRAALDRNPGANLGLWIEGGVVAFDVDPRNSGDRSWDRLTAGVELPDTATAETGGGGRHYLYRLPDGVGPIRGKLAGFEGIEVKASGYIVVEPSVHPGTGEAYRWRIWPDGGIAEIPDALLAKILKPAAPVATKGGRRRIRAPGDLQALRDDLAARFPIERVGQRNERTIQMVGSLAGRGFADATILAVVDPLVLEAVRAGRSRATERKALAAARDVIASTRRNPDFVVNDSADAIWAAIDSIELAAWQTDAIAGEFGQRRRADDTPLTSLGYDDDANSRDRAKTNTSRGVSCGARYLTPNERVFVEALLVMARFEIESRRRTTVIEFTHAQISEIAVRSGRRDKPWQNTSFDRLKRLFIRRIPGRCAGPGEATEAAELEELFIEVSKGCQVSGKPSRYRPSGIWRFLRDDPGERPTEAPENEARGPPWRASAGEWYDLASGGLDA